MKIRDSLVEVIKTQNILSSVSTQHSRTMLSSGKHMCIHYACTNVFMYPFIQFNDSFAYFSSCYSLLCPLIHLYTHFFNSSILYCYTSIHLVNHLLNTKPPLIHKIFPYPIFHKLPVLFLTYL